MDYDVRGIHVTLTEAIQTHVEQKIAHVTGRFQRLVRNVEVHLVDTNGPKKGPDKLCKVLATLRNSERIVIEETAADLYAAIDVGLDRLKQVLGRRIEKLPRAHSRDHRRASDRPLLA